jgi:soluble cytochrome b562
MRSQLEDFLKDVGVYSEDELNMIMEFNEEVRNLEAKIKAGGDINEGKEAAVRLKTLRMSLLILLSRKFEYDKYTIEHNVENAKFDFLLTKCILDEDKKPVFKDVADYKDNEELREDLQPMIKALADLTSAFDSQFEQKLPENQFLKKYDFCDENFNLKGEEVSDMPESEESVGEFVAKKTRKKRATKKPTAEKAEVSE